LHTAVTIAGSTANSKGSPKKDGWD